MSYQAHADIGGRTDLGPVIVEPNEPLFHAPWEKRALAVTLAMGATGAWNLDISRSAREQLPDYLSSSYYELWTRGLERLLANAGLVSEAELAAGHAQGPPKPLARILTADAVDAALAKGNPTTRPATSPARFAVGDRVRTRDVPQPTGHTRLPRYVQGKPGTVTHCHGVHVFPDAHAAGLGEQPQWLYTVRFAATDLFDTGADPTVSVSVDAWESYLSPA